MKSKAREELKPQQPTGCEDFDDDRNAAIRFLGNPDFMWVMHMNKSPRPVSLNPK